MMAAESYSGLVMAGLAVVSVIGSGAWALVQVCMRLDRMERALDMLVEAHSQRETREGR